MTFEDFLDEWRSDLPYIEAKTSGSTGKPKTIRLPKSFVRESALRTNSFFNIGNVSRIHSCVSPDFIGGKMMAVRSEVAGCRLTFEEPSNRPLCSVSPAEMIDLLAVVPSQMIYLLDNLDKLPAIGAIIIGGSAIAPGLRRKIAHSGLRAFETYGMTETSSHIALRRVTDHEDWFECLPGITVCKDIRGCLEIRFHTGERVVTNDLADIETECRFKVVGRYDHVIITGGKKINPYELEREISGYVDGEFIITSEPDEKWGRIVVLMVEGKDDGSGSTIISRLRDLLPGWMIPKKVVWIDRLPRTENGKIKR